MILIGKKGKCFFWNLNFDLFWPKNKITNNSRQTKNYADHFLMNELIYLSIRFSFRFVRVFFGTFFLIDTFVILLSWWLILKLDENIWFVLKECFWMNKISFLIDGIKIKTLIRDERSLCLSKCKWNVLFLFIRESFLKNLISNIKLGLFELLS